jgi:hypothetical protein
MGCLFSTHHFACMKKMLTTSVSKAKVGQVGLFVGRVMLIENEHQVCPYSQEHCAHYRIKGYEERHDEGPGGEVDNMRLFGMVKNTLTSFWLMKKAIIY